MGKTAFYQLPYDGGMKQESVWNYPRPPLVELCPEQVRVMFHNQTVVDTTRAYRVLETSHPPTYYLPQADIKMEFFTPSPARSFCEFKGSAVYWDLRVGEHVSIAAAWSYPSPSQRFSVLRDHLAFYSQRVDACFVGEERVQPQQGDFYGGWITSNLVGPFKGVPGSSGW